MDNFSTRLDLLKFNGARLVKTKDGQRGVFIPVEKNPAIYVGSKRIYLNLAHVALKQPGPYGDTHLVRGNIDQTRFEAMSDEEKRAQPILGNSRPMKPVEMAATNMSFEDDDLPEA